jgi:hypothetical protein
MVNYASGKIYKIVCNKTGLIYVGSTCEPTLARRLAKHVGNYKEFVNGTNHFITSFKIIENNDYDIVLIEDCPCETKDHLHKRERFYIESIECVNKMIPTRTREEYRQTYVINPISRKATRDKYYKKLCQKREEEKKKYEETHTEEIKQKQLEKEKLVIIKNEQIRQKRKEKIHCICGVITTYGDKSTHCKSQRHQNYIKSHEGV